MKTWLKWISVFCLTLSTVFIAFYYISAPKSENCSICCHMKAHAPCLLNLSTGELSELELFEPHYSEVGEIDEEQDASTFGFIYAAGLKGIKLTNPWYIKVSIPMKGDFKDVSHFCKKHRVILKDIKSGFALLDLYQPDDPVVYTIYGGVQYRIRSYTVMISAQEDRSQYELYVAGEKA